MVHDAAAHLEDRSAGSCCSRDSEEYPDARRSEHPGYGSRCAHAATTTTSSLPRTPSSFHACRGSSSPAVSGKSNSTNSPSAVEPGRVLNAAESMQTTEGREVANESDERDTSPPPPHA